MFRDRTARHLQYPWLEVPTRNVLVQMFFIRNCYYNLLHPIDYHWLIVVNMLTYPSLISSDISETDLRADDSTWSCLAWKTTYIVHHCHIFNVLGIPFMMVGWPYPMNPVCNELDCDPHVAAVIAQSTQAFLNVLWVLGPPRVKDWQRFAVLRHRRERIFSTSCVRCSVYFFLGWLQTESTQTDIYI